MRTSLRSIAFALAASFGVAAVAQNVVTVMGAVSPCVGVSYPVHIMTNTVPPIDTTVYTGANCQYSFTFYPDSTLGTVLVSTSCDGGITWVSATGSWNPFFPTVIIDLACNGGSPCNACFTVGSSQPWQVEFTNCTSGGVAPYSYMWDFADGSVSILANPVWTATVPGIYFPCLTITDANGCTNTTCDSLSIDANGNVNGSFIPCYACIDAIPATNGPAGPPIPWTIDAINCSSGGVAPATYGYFWNDGSTEAPPRTFTQPGWYQVCIVMTDANGCTSTACDSVMIDGDGTVDPVDPGDCTAGFWVMQGYTIDSLNPGTATPIPNELWIWNLSTGANTSVSLNLSTIAGINVVTLPVGCNPALVGAQVSGPNVPGGTTIISVDCPNVLLSQNATVTGTAVHSFIGTMGTIQFEWSWGDGTPNSTDPYPTHVYANGGPYLLCLTITDISGCTDTACDSISVDGNGFYTGMAANPEANGNGARSGFTVNVLNELPVTGINDRPVEEPTLAWPNPVEDVLNLRFNTTVHGNVPMTIIDLNGRAVRTEQVMINAGGNNLQVPVSDLAPGLYMMRFGNDAKAVAFRFVKR